MKNYKKLLIVFLCAVAIFTSFSCLLLLKEKFALIKSIEEMKVQIQTLESEKRDLSQKIEKAKAEQERLNIVNSQLKDNLKASEEKAIQIATDLAKAKQELAQLNSRLSLLETDLGSLKKEKDSLNQQLTAAGQVKGAARNLEAAAVQNNSLESAAKRGNKGFFGGGKQFAQPEKVVIEVTDDQSK